MAESSSDDFARLFRLGCYDSICRHCFVTVGSAKAPGDLERYEEDHICEPDDRALYDRGQQERSNPHS